jgi:DNA-binding response OmpR family regulator
MTKILIVDDSALMRRLLRRMLEPRGYAVVDASDGAGAQHGFASEHPDLVLLDLNLEVESGLDVLAQLRDRDRDVRVIIVTADTEESTRIAIEQGGARLLLKPFEPATVAAAVAAALADSPPPYGSNPSNRQKGIAARIASR